MILAIADPFSQINKKDIEEILVSHGVDIKAEKNKLLPIFFTLIMIETRLKLFIIKYFRDKDIAIMNYIIYCIR